MKIKFLGTGSGLANLNRFHSSLLISVSDHCLLLECGDGISRAILSQKIDFDSIDSILISHFHADHFSGLPSLLTQMKLKGRKKNLSIFICNKDKDFLERFISHSYMFKERLTFDLNIISFNQNTKVKLSEHLSFSAKLNSHLNKYRSFEKENQLSFISLSFLFQDDIMKTIYTGDIGSEEDLYLFTELADFFISETTHISPSLLINLAREKQHKNIIITHLDEFSENEANLHIGEIGDSDLRDRFIIASEGLEIGNLNS